MSLIRLTLESPVCNLNLRMQTTLCMGGTPSNMSDRGSSRASERPVATLDRQQTFLADVVRALHLLRELTSPLHCISWN